MKKRKVNVYKNKGSVVDGKVAWIRTLDYTAVFHQFGVDFEEHEEGPGNYSTAIVEKEDGTIMTPDAKLVQFTDKAIKKTKPSDSIGFTSTDVMELYNKTFEGKNYRRKNIEKSTSTIRARIVILSKTTFKSLDEWELYFKVFFPLNWAIKGFKSGDRSAFKMNMDYLVRPITVSKVYDGVYHER